MQRPPPAIDLWRWVDGDLRVAYDSAVLANAVQPLIAVIPPPSFG